MDSFFGVFFLLLLLLLLLLLFFFPSCLSFLYSVQTFFFPCFYPVCLLVRCCCCFGRLSVDSLLSTLVAFLSLSFGIGYRSGVTVNREGDGVLHSFFILACIVV